MAQEKPSRRIAAERVFGWVCNKTSGAYFSQHDYFSMALGVWQYTLILFPLDKRYKSF